MEDKKQSLAILLIILVVITYFQYISSKDQKRKALQKQAAQNTQVNPAATTQNTAQIFSSNPTAQASAQIANNLQSPSIEQLQSAEKTIFSNGALITTFNHLGAKLQSLELIGVYKDLGKTALYNLINLEDKFPLPAGVNIINKSTILNDENLAYSLTAVEGANKTEQGYTILANDSKFVFSADLNNNSKLIKTYSFKKDSYLFSIKAEIQSPDNLGLELKWPIHIKKADLEQRYDPYFFTTLDTEKKVSHIQALSVPEELSKNKLAQWISFGDRYFMTTILPQSQDKIVRVDSAPELFTLVNKSGNSSIESSIYAGPKNYESLIGYGHSLERSIDLGFVSFISYPLLQLLRFLYSFFGNYGVAIIALTLIVKTALYPLNKASLKSMKGMQEIAPEINSLKERIKDPSQLNKEIFALYKRKGVNPMGGCLPIAIQIPVFFGLYSALQNAVELRHAPFALWVKDLATPEKLSIIGINVPVMVIAMGVIMFIQQYRTPMPNVEPAQRKMILSMSVVFTLMFLIFPFPAGLALYMLINTIISLIQQQSLKSETLNSPFKVTVLASFAILAVSLALTKL